MNYGELEARRKSCDEDTKIVRVKRAIKHLPIRANGLMGKGEIRKGKVKRSIGVTMERK